MKTAVYREQQEIKLEVSGPVVRASRVLVHFSYCGQSGRDRAVDGVKLIERHLMNVKSPQDSINTINISSGFDHKVYLAFGECKPRNLTANRCVLMATEAVIFDLDGTITSFNLDYKSLRGEVREYLLRAGVPSSLLKVNESVFEMLQEAEIYFKNNKPSQAFKETRAQCLSIAEKHEMQAAALTSLQPGAVDALKELKQMKLKIGLCTTSSETAVNYILQRFKISEYFQVVVSRDKVKNVKPDTEQFELALKALGAKPATTVIVGDSVADMQSAKDLKSVAVGIPTGLATQKKLETHGANYIITSLIDLPVLIKKMDKV